MYACRFIDVIHFTHNFADKLHQETKKGEEAFGSRKSQFILVLQAVRAGSPTRDRISLTDV